MNNWKYTDATNRVVFRTLDNGGMESCLVSELPEGNTPEPADPVPNPRIAEIKAELATLDQKKIRPLAEGDTKYLAGLNAQTAKLRAELQTL